MRFLVKEEDMGLVVPTGVITAVGKTLMDVTLSLANADATRDGEVSCLELTLVPKLAVD